MIIKIEDSEERNYEATVELEPDGLVWFTIEKNYKSSTGKEFQAFLSAGFALELGQALIKVSKG